MQEIKSTSAELSELRLSTSRLESESRDAQITLDTYKDRIMELQKDIDEHKIQIEDLKKQQTREKEEEKARKRKERALKDTGVAAK